MNAIEILKQDHEKAKATLARIQHAGPEQRGQLWRALKPELKVHEQLEEAYFYGPMGRDVQDDTLRAWNERHHQEVGTLEGLIQRLDGLAPSDQAWLAGFQELQRTIGQHIEEEENVIWPRARQAWDRVKLENAGEEMEANKEAMLRQAA